MVPRVRPEKMGEASNRKNTGGVPGSAGAAVTYTSTRLLELPTTTGSESMGVAAARPPASSPFVE
jgi:hypothetical protein